MQFFNILIGIILQIYIFRNQFIISFLATLICYLCMKYINNKKFSAYLVFILSMSLLSGVHIYRMIIDYGNWSLDINVILMIYVCKYSSVAFNYYDSQRDEKDLTEYMKTQYSLFFHNLEFFSFFLKIFFFNFLLFNSKLERLPNILEYFSYIYFIPGCVVGPFFEYKDYENFMYNKGDYNCPNKPNRFPIVIKKFFLGILFAIFLIISENISNTDIILDETGKYSNQRQVIKLIKNKKK